MARVDGGGGERGSAPLGNSRTELAPQVRRGVRYRRRQFLARFTSLRRLSLCGRRLIRGRAVELVQAVDGTAHFAGVSTCGLVWACPVCGPKIRAGRAEEVGRALGNALGRGMGVAFLTLTCRHHRGQRLTDLRRASEFAWKALQQSRTWRQLRDTHGVELVQVREVTYGDEHGWHPHRHMAVVTRAVLSAWEVEAIEDDVWREWLRALRRYGLDAERGPGCRFESACAPGALGRYMAKVNGDLGAELARGDLKRARRGHRTPEQLLGDVVETGDADDLRLWREYEQATKGWRMFTWSRGLRSKLLDGEGELSDEELAAPAVGGEVLAVIDQWAWAELCALSAGAVALLEAAEAGRWLEYLQDVVPGGWRAPPASVPPEGVPTAAVPLGV